ncbi:hypothetical protein DF268_19140 [Streptomyces sp. V2]|uniref:hypothetical protein n=1 Tax=Streptomyces TaxID=1883 RepID=UPI0006EB968D|nr:MULTISPECIES: hypothetical protein [Streptomyces]PWG11876.1 hypothetical protein DF268_19140 [Streptomyces sp. V2]
MTIHLEDRWYRRGAPGSERVPTARHGQQPRYRAHFTARDGSSTAKTFRRRRDAERWLTRTRTTHLLKGHA